MTATINKIHIEKHTSMYNHRRYSKPWIAVVDFSQNPQGQFGWGDWVGDHYNGSDGLLVVAASINDIVATGQKDFRQPKNSAPDWWYVGEDGKLHILDSKADAYKYYQDTHK